MQTIINAFYIKTLVNVFEVVKETINDEVYSVLVKFNFGTTWKFKETIAYLPVVDTTVSLLHNLLERATSDLKTKQKIQLSALHAFGKTAGLLDLYLILSFPWSLCNFFFKDN